MKEIIKSFLENNFNSIVKNYEYLNIKYSLYDYICKDVLASYMESISQEKVIQLIPLEEYKKYSLDDLLYIEYIYPMIAKDVLMDRIQPSLF